MLIEVSLYEWSGNACLHQSKQAGCWTQELHMHSTCAHGIKEFSPIRNSSWQRSFSLLEQLALKIFTGYTTHTHTLGYQHSRDRSKSELHWNNHSFHPIACQMEMYSYYFHHNWLQNISKMSKFRIRWSEHRHSLNFFVVFLSNPPVQTFLEYMIWSSFFQLFGGFFLLGNVSRYTGKNRSLG